MRFSLSISLCTDYANYLCSLIKTKQCHNVLILVCLFLKNLFTNTIYEKQQHFSVTHLCAYNCIKKKHFNNFVSSVRLPGVAQLKEHIVMEGLHCKNCFIKYLSFNVPMCIFTYRQYILTST